MLSLNVKIVTDSTADIPKHIIEQLNIHVVPLTVLFGDQESFEDGVDLTADQFYEKLTTSEVIPSTSQPTPYQFSEVYKAIATEHESPDIISIHVSSKLSGTYQSAHIASDMVKDETEVTVVDTKKASYAVGVIVVEIAKLAQNGATKEQCLERMSELLKDTSVYFLVDTLEFLQKNGRLGTASAVFGSILKIKPILSLNKDGEVFPYDKVRGQKKAVSKILEYLERDYGQEVIHVGISHANCKEDAIQIMSEMRQRFNMSTEVITDIGPVVGAHVGPGAVAISVTIDK